MGTHFGTAQQDALQLAEVSGFVEIQGKGSETGVAVGKVNSNTDALRGNFTAFNVHISSNGTILTDTNLIKSGNTSDFAVNPSENVEKSSDSVRDVVNGSSGGSGHSESDKNSSINSSSSFIEEKNSRFCDVTKGKWVFDESYPLYSHSSCPFIDEGFSCEANGRLDKDYTKWRWQPRDCDIPR